MDEKRRNEMKNKAKKERSGNMELLSQAIAFSARAHQNQFRKDGVTPYASHPFRVAMTVRNVFDVKDERILATAVLHDTIEDTRTDRDDLIEQFGPVVAEWVSLLSKDKRLEDSKREEQYARALSSAPDAVKIVKLADIYDNLLDSRTLTSVKRKKTQKRTGYYLRALMVKASPDVKAAAAIVEAAIKKGI